MMNVHHIWSGSESVGWIFRLRGIGDRAEIEYFNGPHMIRGVRTYQFQHKWLRWPQR
jgi:hypothetical protein